MCSRGCGRGVLEGVAVQDVHWLNCCWCDVEMHSNWKYYANLYIKSNVGLCHVCTHP